VCVFACVFVCVCVCVCECARQDTLMQQVKSHMCLSSPMHHVTYVYVTSPMCIMSPMYSMSHIGDVLHIGDVTCDFRVPCPIHRRHYMLH